MKIKRSIKITNNKIDIHIQHSQQNNKYTEYLYKEGKLYTHYNNRPKYYYRKLRSNTKFYSQKWNC